MQSTTQPPDPAPNELGSEPAVPGPHAPTTRVGATVAALSELGTRALADHPEIYDRIHTELRAALAEVDQ